MDKNNMYLAIGGTAIVAVLIAVSMVLASGYAGTLTGIANDTSNTVDDISSRLGILKSEADQINSTVNLNLQHTDAIVPALNAVNASLSDEINSASESLNDELNAVNSSLSDQLGQVNTDLFNEMNAVNSSLYNQLIVINSNLANQMAAGFSNLTNQLTTAFSSLSSQLSSSFSSLSSQLTTAFTNLSSQLTATNSSLSNQMNAVNVSLYNEMSLVNVTLFDQMVTINGSLQDNLGLVQGNLTDLEQKLWSADDSVKNDTKQIADILADLVNIQGNVTALNATLSELNGTLTIMNNTLNHGTQTVAASGVVTLPNGTANDTYGILLADSSTASKISFILTPSPFLEDFTTTDGDAISYSKTYGASNNTVTITTYLAVDGDLTSEFEFGEEFIASMTHVYITLADTLDHDVTIYYAITLTTEADATAWIYAGIF